MDNFYPDLSQPQLIHAPTLAPSPGLAIALLPGGKQVLTSGLDFQLRLWALEEGRCLQSWQAGGPLNTITVDEQGKTAFLGAVQGFVRWDLERWDLHQPNTLWSHKAITAAAYADSTGELLGGSEDSTIHRWRLPTLEKLNRLTEHEITITAVDVDNAGRLALSGDLYGVLRLWDLANNTCLRTWQGHQKPISGVAISSDDHLALTGGQDGRLILWDLEHGQPLRSIQDSWIEDLALSRDSHWALSCGENGLTCWDIKTGEMVASYHDERITALSLSLREDLLIGLVKSNRLLLWDLTSA